MLVRLAEILLKLTKKLKDAHWHDPGDEAEIDALIQEMEEWIEEHE